MQVFSLHSTPLHAFINSCSEHNAMQVKLRGSISSQYLTALLMAAPLAQGPGSIDIVISDELVSQPYVAMTVKMMAGFGVQVCPTSLS